MEENEADVIRLLTKRAGLDLPDEEIEKLIPFYKRNIERLEALHSADLENEEVGGIFPAPVERRLGGGAVSQSQNDLCTPDDSRGRTSHRIRPDLAR